VADGLRRGHEAWTLVRCGSRCGSSERDVGRVAFRRTRCERKCHFEHVVGGTCTKVKEVGLTSCTLLRRCRLLRRQFP